MTTLRQPCLGLNACLFALLLAYPSVAAGPPPVGEMARVIASDRHRLALKELFFLGLCIEGYAVDHSAYPAPGPLPVPIVSLKAVLAPYSQSVAPELDPWHSAYLYWSDGSNYVIISLGPDARADLPYPDLAAKGYSALSAAALTGQREAPGTDLIFANGIISRWTGPKVIAPFN